MWKYSYDERNQLFSAKRYWPDWTPVAGQQFEYVFDHIGNRTSTKMGGDAGGINLRSETYSPNVLDQYSQKTVSEAVDVIGAATATAAVVVNGTSAYERGEYFRAEVSVTNNLGPVYPTATVTAVDGAGNTNRFGSILVPPATQNFQYDGDGNLTNDSVWMYEWDAENRLKRIQTLSSVPELARRTLTFTYDDLGRRASKIVSNWIAGAWELSSNTRFVYDGWNLLAELNATNNAVIRSYLWGQDLSGTVEKAGGVGGLLMLTEHDSVTTNHFVAYDGRGNVTALIRGDAAVSARYEYSPFGETIRATGPSAKPNPFRFSTKFWDEESGLVYYGSRFYTPTLGRWLSKDPLGVASGRNLYCFLRNNSLRSIDPHGGTEQPLPGTGDWKSDTQLRALLPQTFANIDAEFERLGFSDKYLRGAGFGSAEAIAAQRDELARAQAFSTVEKTLFAIALAKKVYDAAQWVGSGKADELMQHAQNYGRHMAEGEQAWADLDAIDIALDLMDLTGSYETAYVALDILL